MSLWPEVWVWTAVERQRYALKWFNQSAGGVFDYQPDGYHFALHTDGNGHIRWPGGPAQHPDISFVERPISDISIRWIGSAHLSLNPSAVKAMGKPLRANQTTRRSIYLDPADFGPWIGVVIESVIFEPSLRNAVTDQIRAGLAFRPHMTLLEPREYLLDGHGKRLGVYVYSSHYQPTSEGVGFATPN